MPPLFRADHIGSYLRPQSLIEARKTRDPAKTYTADHNDAVSQAEVAAIKEVISEQISRGVYPLTNGEYPREIFYVGFFEKLGGMTTFPQLPVPEAFRSDFPTTTGLLKQFGIKHRAIVVATGRITFPEDDPPYLAEWLELRNLLPDQSYWSKAKLTIPAPSWQQIQVKPGTAYTDSSPYRSDEEYFHDLASCYTKTITTLYDNGCRIVQIDDPHLTYFCDEIFLAGCRKDGTDTDALLDLYIKVYHWIVSPIISDAKYEDLRIGLHLCRGNMSGSTHWVNGGYEKIARKLFNETKGIDTFYLEFDDEARDGGFEPLRFLPREEGKGKVVVLGLVSTKVAELEDKEKMAEKMRKAARVIAEAWGTDEETALKEALAVSPQCGFSSHSMYGGKGMTLETMWKKLALVKAIAEEVFPQA